LATLRSAVTNVHFSSSGYYRVNYEKDYWMKLIDLLTNPTFKLGQIHEINRAAIIDDVMNLARADYVDYKLAISATMYLKREIDYLPWRAFYNNLPYLNNRFRGRDIESLYKVRVYYYFYLFTFIPIWYFVFWK